VIYLDTSVALAHLLAEDRRPPPQLWAEELWSSRLLEYELWNRIHALDLARSHGDLVRLLLARVSLIELDPTVLGRATQPFPAPTRTLDALHLASASWLRERGGEVRVATYDRRLAGAAQAMGLEAVELEG
jgi:predicted nucleic acid-binding protein